MFKNYFHGTFLQKRPRKDAFTWFCLKMLLARQHLLSLNSEAQLSPSELTVSAATLLTPEEETVWAVRGLGGPTLCWPYSTLDPLFENSGSLTNKKCWHSVHFSEMSPTKKEKLMSWLLTTSKPQAGNRKQMSSMECFAPGNFSSPCFYSKGTEGMEEEHKRALFLFFFLHLPWRKATCPKTGFRSKARQAKEGRAAASMKNGMLPTSVSANYLRPPVTFSRASL